MPVGSLQQMLTGVLGHLAISTPEHERDFGRLQDFFSRSIIPDDLQELTGSRFAFENADLFSRENVAEDRLAAIRGLAVEVAEPEYRVFVREVPVRSTQLHASNPLWAGGAAAESTVGPFARADGRLLWFDFFRIEKLVALYVQGSAQPALLFKITTGVLYLDINLPLAAEASSQYKLGPGSIWINSQLLAPTAPTGDFTGLTIAGGTISLSASPQLINGKLTVAANATVQVQLSLKQPPVNGADPSSPYGKDARQARLDLPKSLAFHFTGQASGLTDSGDAAWVVYGHSASFKWAPRQVPSYDGLLHRVLIPFTASTKTFRVNDSRSPFHTLTGETPITGSFWALPAAAIDVANPSPAVGIGAMLVRGGAGLTASWSGLRGAPLRLNDPYVMAEPGRISISDLTAGNVVSHQDFSLWKDAQNSFGTNVRLQYPAVVPLFYNSLASGVELLMTRGHADVQADRPVTVKGAALQIRSRNSLLVLAATSSLRLIYLFDDDILVDSLDVDQDKKSLPKPISLALHNALFKVTPVNGCLLFGQLAEDFVKVEQGNLFLTFGLFAYLPTLPDPYAANLGRLKAQFRGSRDAAVAGTAFGNQTIRQLFVSLVKWQPGKEGNDHVDVSFHFAPPAGQAQSAQPGTAPSIDFLALAGSGAVSQPQAYVRYEDESLNAKSARAGIPPLPDYEGTWNAATGPLRDDYFALIDVSTNADLLGVSFGVFLDRRFAMVTTLAPAGSTGFPLQVQGMDVVSRGLNVRAFTVPQISWEPVHNLTPPQVVGDPAAGFNYYPNDGGPTRILNNSGETVALAPIPLTDFLVKNLATKRDFAALSLFTLPFGMRAMALWQKEYVSQGHPRPGTRVDFNSKTFPNNSVGGRQLQVDGGEALRQGESDMFMGSTLQINNILDLSGNSTGNSTLGRTVTRIYNNEWMLEPFQLIRDRGVPLERMDLSGYGASVFSNWLNPSAAVAETSQAKFDVWVGRCAHEIIQVKSILYPWAIHVVRTITLFRTPSGYVYRYDTGWRAESDGRFDFTYFVYVNDGGTLKPVPRNAPYDIHPGVVKGLYLVKDIQETDEILPFTGKMQVFPPDKIVDINGQEVNAAATGSEFDFELQPVFFNADVEIEDPISGFVGKEIKGKQRKLVPAKRILGFVQIAPRGLPLAARAFKDLITRQAGSIGAALDCVLDIGKSGQQMRLTRFDMSNSFQPDGVQPAFVVSGRGTVLLPKDGSWSMVKHEFGTGEVSPVPQDLSVPLIRIGKYVRQSNGEMEPDVPVADALLRIANPTELLRPAVADTLNYGFLQTTDTQKALFLTPAFRQGVGKLLSKTPPLFADGFRICRSKAIFPNVGNASTNFGDAISLATKGSEFVKSALADGGTQVMEVMQINNVAGPAVQQGYKLLKQVEEFELPSTELVLIELGGSFKIYLEYKADKIQKPASQGGGTRNATGALDFDVNSFASNVTDQWKSRMSNLGVVIDLGPIKRLMTIKGNWDARKGAAAQYGGSLADPDFPSPQIEFAKELKPVIEILQILQDLQGENYKDAFQRGLKLAMSNKAGSWEYKLEATKEIPVIRFPMPAFLYNDPNAALKLEAGLRLGAYFNAALNVTGDANQVLPTAGAFLGFYGRMSVMCVSLSAATVYAVGQVTLDIAADTKVGPSLKMKFGLGAQIVVGLPVVGNVSVLYMVGVEIYTDSTSVIVSAFLLFQGHAELLAGLVAVTITIEAKGTVARIDSPGRTNLAAQVTFGLDISIFLIINISFSTSWQEQRQIA